MCEQLHRTNQLPSSFSVQALKQIVHNCKRNEQYLQELIYHTRHERRKVQDILSEFCQRTQTCNKPNPSDCRVSSRVQVPKSVQFFIPFNDNDKDTDYYHRKQANQRFLNERGNKPFTSILRPAVQSYSSNNDNTLRVRFNIPESTYSTISSCRSTSSIAIDEQLSSLARRCEDLLKRLDSCRDEKLTFNYPNFHSKRILDVECPHQDFSPCHQNRNLSYEYNLKFDRKCQQTHPFCQSNLTTNHVGQTNLTRLPMKNYDEYSSYINDRHRHGYIIEQ